MSGKNHCILIVDDDTEFHQQIRYAFRRQFVFEGAVDGERMFRKLEEKSAIDLILLDLVFDHSQEKVGLSLIPRLREAYPHLPVIVVTSERSIDTVVQAMKLGAKDFLVKSDFDFDYWQDKFSEIISAGQLRAENEQLRAEVKRRRAQENEAFSFIGESPRIQEIKRILRLVSEEPDLTILLTGETGTGKEVAARYLHQHGARSEGPFQAVNLSAIQDTLLESTLFGHRKGAFTGATRDMEGYFAQAHGGILMLDEIGDIDQNIQVKLLRFLETKLIRPVGSDRDIQLDVQVVAATHRNLDTAVREGRFRSDLYQRLKAMVIDLPPLRERLEDIDLLLQHYFGVDDLSSLLTSAAHDRLLAYDWVGNIRELKNAVSYMLLRKKILGRERIDDECLPTEIRGNGGTPPPPRTPYVAAATPPGPPARNLDEEHALIDLENIEQLLLRKNRVKKDVALEMGLENTDNLRYRIKKHFDKHPHLFSRFPTIRDSYRKIVKP